MKNPPWDDLSDLENHWCHKHEIYYEEFTGILVCEFCCEAKIAKHFKIQKEQSNERRVHQEAKA